MKKKHVLLTAVLCLSMAVFTGCGSGDSDTDSQVTESPAADATPDATDGSVMDDVEDGARDVLDGAEDAVDDTMDGARNAVDDAEDAMDGDDSDTNNSVTNGDKN